MRKSATAVMILLLISLPMLYMTSGPTPNQTTKTTTTTITGQRAGGTNYTIPLITNRNFSVYSGSPSLPVNWTFDEWGYNPESASGAIFTNDYYTSPASAYLRLQQTYRQCELGWTQPFTYSGTTPVLSASLTFRWKCYRYNYAGSTNYIEIYLEAPKYSDNWIRVYHEHFYSTTGWNFRSLDISSYLNDYGPVTYQLEPSAYLTTSGGTPDVRVLYDDVGISVKYNVPSAPTGLSITINNNATYTKNVSANLTLAAIGADYMQFSNSSGGPWTSWEPFAPTKQVSLTSGNGAKNIYFKANNTWGVTGPTSDSIIYDGNAPPAPKLQSPTNGTAINNNAPTFSWSTVTDNGPSGLATYSLDYSKDKTFVTGVTTVPVPSGTTSYTPSSLADGTWYWRVKAIDNAGNAGPYNGTNWFVVIDTAYPPGPTLTSPPTGSVTKINSVTFTWNPSQDPSPSSGIASYTLQYSKDPSFVTGVTTVSGLTGTSYPASGLSDGTWYWRVRAVDNAGNTGSYSGYWSIVIDIVAPSPPTLISPTNGTNTNDNTPTFTWGAASDPAPSSGVASYTLQFSQDPTFVTGVTTVTGLGLSYNFTSSLSDGTWYWRVRAVDNAGNTGTNSAYWSIVVDTASPAQPAPSSPIDGSIMNVNTPTFTWGAASDPAPSSGVASYTFQIDTSSSFNSGNLRTIAGLSLSYSVPSGSPLSDGTWYWRVRAIDNAGNAGSYSPSSRIIIVDTINPGAPTLVSPTSGSATNNSKPTFTWGAASDPAPSSGITYTLQLDTSTSFNSGNLRTITSLGLSYIVPGGAPLGDGIWYWRVRAVDNAGNPSSYSGYWSITVDTQAPGLPTLTSPASGTNTNVNTPTFTWGAASDPAPSSGITYTLQLDTSTSFNSGNLRTISGLTGTSYTVAAALSDGIWYWRVRAVDRAGNPGSYSGYWSIVIDIVAPSPPTLISPTNGTNTNDNTPTFTWGAASDPAPSSGVASYALQYSKDKSFLSGVTTVSGLAGTSYTVTSPLGDGTWYWRVRAVDNAGNPGSYSSYWSIVIDTVIPGAPSLLAPVNGQMTNSSTQTFSWTNVSASTYDFYIDKSPAFNTVDLKTYLGLSNFSKVVRNLSDGNWYWKVIAQRIGGSNSSTTWGIIIDTVAPGQPTLTSPSTGTNTNDNTPTFTWGAASDPAPSSGITYTLQLDTNPSFNNNTGNLRTISGLAGTSYTVPSGLPLSDRNSWRWRVGAVDRAGNQGSYSGSWTLTVDTAVPGLPTLTSPASGTNTNVNTPTFTWGAASDPAPSSGITYTLQYSKDQTFTSGVTTVSGLIATNYIVPGGSPLGDGAWYWRVRAVDNAGNPGSYSSYWSIVIDTVNPSAPTLTGPLTGSATNHTTPTFTWGAASDPAPSSGITYTLQLDTSSSFSNATGKLRTMTSLGLSYIVPGGSPLGDGAWYWRVRAVDNAGNPGSYSGYWSITVDTQAPSQPTLSSLTNGAHTNTTRPSLVWNAATDTMSGVASYTLQYSMDKNFLVGVYTFPLLGTSYTLLSALVDGTWYWHVKATDNAGNPGSYSGYWNFTVDTQPPTGLTLSPVGGIYTNSLTITLSITANGAQKMYLSNDGANWVEYDFATTKSWTLTAGDGAKNVYFKCRDAAGNWAYLPGGFTSITLDTVLPIAGSPSVPAHGSIISDNRTALQWIAGSDTGSGIANYTLQLDDNPLFNNAGGKRRTIFGLTGTNYTVSPALTGGTWYWRISATDRADNTGFYSTYFSFILNTTLPGKIPYDSDFWQPLDGSSLKAVSPQFIWNSTVATGADRYHIQIDRYLNFSSSYLIENLALPSNRFSPSADNNETLIDGTWYWRVEAINKAGAHSGYSTTRSFTIDTTPPNSPNLIAPADQVATKISDHIVFSWSPVPGAEMYWMQFDRLPTFDSSDVYKYTEINLTTTSYVYIETLANSLYYWHVFSLDSLGNINNSILVPVNQFMIDTASPSPPYPISPSQGGFTNRTTPTLNWSPATDPTYGGVSSGVANYTLSLDNSSSFNSANLMTIAGLVQAGPDVRYTLTSSLSDGVWYWFVNATDRAGNKGPGFSIIQRFTVDTIAPAPPLTSSMTPNGVTLGANLVSLRWAAPSDTSGIAGYVIQIDASSGFDSGKLLSYTIGSLTSFVPPDALDNGQWYWRIAAVDGAGNRGPWSEAVPFVVNVGGLSPMMVIMLGGGSSGVVVLAVLGYVLYRRAKIPFVIKKLDQSIKLISRGEVPQLVPMRTRSQLIASIYRDKLAILSKEKLEKAEEKKKKVSKEAELGAEKLAPQIMPKGAEAPVKVAAEESDVDLVAKELEKLEGEGGKSADESEMIKREIDELEKGSKKKKDESD